MKKHNAKPISTVAALLAMLLSASLSWAQIGPVGKLPGRRGASSPAQMASRQAGQAKTPGSPSYTYGYLDFPLAPDTAAYGINPGATSSEMELVGAYGPQVAVTGEGSGFFLEVVQHKANFTQTFKTENYPKSTYVLPAGINDSGKIVGLYFDSPNTILGYELSGGKYTKLEVPFSGATYTLPSGINNSGEIVGTWADGSFVDHGFVLSGGVYTSFDYPGAPETDPISVNGGGLISGYYYDSSDIPHGFQLSGGTYTLIDFPGAAGTVAYGNNDAGDVVGFYCLTSGCLTDGFSGAQGFLLSGGVYTTIDVPGASSTFAADINDNGVIVGYYADYGGYYHAFIAMP